MTNKYLSENSLFTLDPYWTEGGSLVFDDLDRDLIAEPFVCNIDEMLAAAAALSGVDPTCGFRVRFSASSFPTSKFSLLWQREEYGGNTYWSPELEQEGWLCPALYKYYEDAPWELHGEFLPLAEGVAGTGKFQARPQFNQLRDGSTALDFVARSLGVDAGKTLGGLVMLNELMGNLPAVETEDTRGQ
jgi:hypothetical protein